MSICTASCTTCPNYIISLISLYFVAHIHDRLKWSLLNIQKINTINTFPNEKLAFKFTANSWSIVTCTLICITKTPCSFWKYQNKIEKHTIRLNPIGLACIGANELCGKWKLFEKLFIKTILGQTANARSIKPSVCVCEYMHWPDFYDYGWKQCCKFGTCLNSSIKRRRHSVLFDCTLYRKFSVVVIF